MSDTEHISELAPTTLETIVDDVERAVESALRIVPIHGLHHRKAATLVYHGGPLLTAIRLVPVFYGAGWADPANAATVAHLTAFLAWLPTSPLIAQLAGEYSVPGQAIGDGECLAPVAVTQVLPSSLADTDIQTMLGALIDSAILPSNTPQTLYVVLVEPGVSVSAFGSKSCSSFCGFHSVTGDGVYYAVLPYPGCPGCLGTLTAEQALTSIISHEFSEAVTDPKPGTGWTDRQGSEVGDLCGWVNKTVDGYVIQKEWDNATHSCV